MLIYPYDFRKRGGRLHPMTLGAPRAPTSLYSQQATLPLSATIDYAANITSTSNYILTPISQHVSVFALF